MDKFTVYRIVFQNIRIDAHINREYAVSMSMEVGASFSMNGVEYQTERSCQVRAAPTRCPVRIYIPAARTGPLRGKLCIKPLLESAIFGDQSDVYPFLEMMPMCFDIELQRGGSTTLSGYSRMTSGTTLYGVVIDDIQVRWSN